MATVLLTGVVKVLWCWSVHLDVMILNIHISGFYITDVFREQHQKSG